MPAYRDAFDSPVPDRMESVEAVLPGLPQADDQPADACKMGAPDAFARGITVAELMRYPAVYEGETVRLSGHFVSQFEQPPMLLTANRTTKSVDSIWLSFGRRGYPAACLDTVVVIEGRLTRMKIRGGEALGLAVTLIHSE